MKIVIITSYFPNACNPVRAIFIKYLAMQLATYAEVEIISPLPYVPFFLAKLANYKCIRGIPRVEQCGDIIVHRPRYLVVPKTEIFNGIMYALGIFKTLSGIKKKSADKELIVHAHSAYPDGMGSILAAKLMSLPLITTAHGSDINVMPELRLLKPQIRFTLNRSDGVIAVSKDILRKIGHLSSNPETVHIPCAGFDPTTFNIQLTDNIRATSDKATILFIGNLFKIKAVDVLIKAISLMRTDIPLQIDIVGEGGEKRALEQLVERLALKDVINFCGRVPHEQIPGLIKKASILCLPSYNEGTPNVVIEALACGIPVVATRVGALPEIINDNNGFLVAAGDPQQLADALTAALLKTWDRRLIAESATSYNWRNIGESNIRYIRGICMNYYSSHK